MEAERSREPQGIPIDVPEDESAVAPAAKTLPVISRCPYCRSEVRAERADWVACEGCLARHHASCWKEHGACASCSCERPLERGRGRARRALVALSAAALVAGMGALVFVSVKTSLDVKKLAASSDDAEARAAERSSKLSKRLKALEAELVGLRSEESDLGDRLETTAQRFKRAADRVNDAAEGSNKLERRLETVESRLDELKRLELEASDRVDTLAERDEALAKKVDSLARRGRDSLGLRPGEALRLRAAQEADRILALAIATAESWEVSLDKPDELLAKRAATANLVRELAELYRMEGLPKTSLRTAALAVELAKQDGASSQDVAATRALQAFAKSERAELGR